MKTLYICGDIHGELVPLVNDAAKEIKDAAILIVGDFGAGFGGTTESYKKIEKNLEERDIELYAIRGNHDDPSWFIDGSHDLPRLKFLKDHTLIDLCGYSIYPVGGATSVDIDLPDFSGKTRRQRNNDLIKYRSHKRVWWPEEVIDTSVETFPIKVDIIVSHDAPLGFEPIPTRTEYMSLETWNSVLEGRKYLDKVLKEINCKRWFYGHHHKSYSGHVGDLLYRCLGIQELYQVPEKEKE